ncbi:MAG: DnaD domain protein [Roseburia sp.]|nr:DnaD domain protein [Roseburia sp.]
MGFLLTNEFTQSITQIPNIFIDDYMPHANGSFVKVYLYLLRHSVSDPSALTIENMADMLSNTETDIVRALKYWEKQKLLSIMEADGQITAIRLLAIPPVAVSEAVQLPERHTYSSLQAEAGAEIVSEATQLPERHTYSPLQAEALKKDSEIESCLSMVEALLGTPLGDAHMQLILYLMSDLGFSMELVITLYETALSRGKSKPRYIEAIALDWAGKGIHTSEEAEVEAASFQGMYKLVCSALGIKRTLAPAERRIIDKWKEFQFPDVVIEEACSRTVLQSGDTNLNYTTKILEDWHKKGVSTLKDIEDCDRSYFRQKNTSRNRITPINKNKFQNFPQRDYSKSESADLERQLLQQ